MNTKKFIISDKQIELDMKLAPYDLWATKVHVLMLEKQKIIEKSCTKSILTALAEIEKEFNQGQFTIDQGCGLHLTIEAKVIEKIGNDGYFMHTARSRNDQVMTCELLYLRENVLGLMDQLISVQKTLINQATKHMKTIIPGYTHMQPAKPTTFGQWSLAYHGMFVKCFDTLQYFYDKYDLCPLGSVESYGTSWNIDRVYTANLLGFGSVWEIPQEVISSRGFPQLAYLGVLKDIAIVISKIASDLLLFTTFEFGYISLSEATAVQMGSVTGSSIMPQKKNPDVLELLRSMSSQVIGYETIVANLLSGLPMGYNRDSREVKEYIELGFSKVGNSLESLIDVLQTVKVNKEKMYQNVLKNYSLATDLSDYIAQKSGLPYRKVYTIVGSIVKEKIADEISITQLSAKEIMEFGKKMGVNVSLTDSELKAVLDPLLAIVKRKHIGGSSPSIMEKMINKRKKVLTDQSNWLKNMQNKISLAKKKTDLAIKNLS